VFRDGHDVLAARALWRPRGDRKWTTSPLAHGGNDRWEGEVEPASLGAHELVVEAWTDPVATWRRDIEVKHSAGQDVDVELEEGARLLEGYVTKISGDDRKLVRSTIERLRDASLRTESRVAAGLDPGVASAVADIPSNGDLSRSAALPVWVDRERAAVGAWYELFPRSYGGLHGAAERLPAVADMGFDVVYLPPIHPIGRTARKGRNNTLDPEPDDVGSPWAIGGPEGGHKAIHPQLGTLEDFRRFVASAKDLGLEVALDIAFQCSPDHPYIREHPEWFQRRPDGTIKTAENPPKRYEDIVNFDWMSPAREALWAELRSVFMHWIAQGVRIFRVDNPHTKPLPFWEWVIGEVHARHPEVIFLAEAFTRPKVMKALAKAGFNQSYTYFTWRNFKHELEEYLTELTQGRPADYMIGNLWPNTPDILPEHLQQGGRPAFMLRAALAATLSSSWGIYSGYELCENRALPGKEEYADSEKYQIVNWDLERPGNIKAWISALNRARREIPALQSYRNLQFHRANNERVLFYSKATPDRSSLVLVAVSLDPYAAQEAILELPLDRLGIPEDETYQVHDVLSGERALWQGASAVVQLTPEKPAALWSVLRFRRSEQGFDYYF